VALGDHVATLQRPHEPWEGSTPVNDQLDVTVQDTEVLDEIEMMTNLIIATSEADGPLPQGRIDEILGVTPNVPRARLG